MSQFLCSGTASIRIDSRTFCLSLPYYETIIPDYHIDDLLTPWILEGVQGLQSSGRTGKYYRHFKGNVYRVLYIAKHSETFEEMVVYQAMYGERGIWVRPKDMFEEVIERNGTSFRRFEPISEDEAKSLIGNA